MLAVHAGLTLGDAAAVRLPESSGEASVTCLLSCSPS